jgi:transcriptional regulator with XRE-family HTH domain
MLSRSLHSRPEQGQVVGVAEVPQARTGRLSDRLEYLFRTVHPKDRRPYTPGEVAEAVNQAAGERVISSTYVWQLRTGRRDNPTQRHLSALAAFFRVSPMYFFEETEADRGAVPPELVAALKDDDVRDMALRATGLSERSLRAIRDMIESARAVEGLAVEDHRNRSGDGG